MPKDDELRQYVNAHIGRQIRRLRADRNVKQDGLSANLDISDKSISRYELGHSRPKLETLYQLADYFDAEITDLIPSREILHFYAPSNGSGFAESKTPFLHDTEKPALLREAKEASDLMMQLKDPETRQKLIALLETLVASQK